MSFNSNKLNTGFLLAWDKRGLFWQPALCKSFAKSITNQSATIYQSWIWKLKKKILMVGGRVGA